MPRTLSGPYLLVSALVTLSLACGDPNPHGQQPPGCATDAECPEAQVCDLERRACVRTEAPKLVIESPSDGSVLTGSTAMVKGLATDDVGKPSRVELSSDDGATWTEVTLDDAGRFEAGVTLPTSDFGSFPLKLRAQDSDGHVAVATVVTRVDNVPPVCTPVSPLPNALLISKDGPTLPVQVSVADGSGQWNEPVISVEEAPTFLPAEVKDGTLTWAWQLPQLNGEVRQVIARVKDAGGNACEVVIPVTIDTVGPQLELTQPSPDTLLGPETMQSVVFAGTAYEFVPENSAASVTVDFKDGAGPRPATVNTGSWSVTVPLPPEDFVPHEVEVVAKDAAGNQVVQKAVFTVDRVAPALNITAPTELQKFNASAFPSGDAVTATWSALDGDPGSKVEYQIGGGSWVETSLSALTVPTSATDNGVTYSFRVRVTDRAGNEAAVLRNFSVDRVSPTATLDRVNQSRNAPPEVTAQFSEPVTGTGAPLTLTPAGGTPTTPGAWTASSFALSALKGDTVYTATLTPGAVQDLHGNPSVGGATVKFHTAPAQPPSGTTTTLRNDVLSFDAFSDPDGVVTLALETTAPIPLSLSWFHPTNAALVSNVDMMKSGTLLRLNASSWSEVNVDLSSSRQRAFEAAFSGSNWLTLGFEDATFLPGGTSDASLIPLPQGCADPASLPSFGAVTTNKQFVRGAQVEPVTLLPQKLLIANPDYWELVTVDAGVLKAQARVCSCNPQPGSCGWQAARSVLPVGQTFPVLPADVRLSVTGTAAGTRRLYVFDDGTGKRYEVCESCSGFGCVGGSLQGIASEGLHVASARSGNKVLGARKSSAGVQLVQRDLQTSCTVGWTVLATVPGTTGATVKNWRPAMFGAKPGVLFLDGTTLKVHIP